VADLRISELAALASADLATGDFLAVADVSASDTRRITVTGFIDKAVTLISDATIPNAKILFTANTLNGDALGNGTVSGDKLSNNTITDTKLANNSTCQLVAALPASGSYVGQLALNTSSDVAYIWNGSQWIEFKAAGSVNEIIGSSAGVVNVVVTQVGDSVTISTTLDDTTAASQFLAGPTSSGGATTYRAIEGADLPTATTTAKGAVVVNGNGLTLSGNTIAIDNSVEAEATDYHVVQYDTNGLVTAGRLIQSGDLPEATAGATGVVRPGTGLAVDVAGTLNHSNVIVGGSGTKVTFDSEGHITATEGLAAADIPDLSADKITTGQLPTERIANGAITGPKLAAASVTKIGGSADTGGIVVFPTPDYSGQYFYDSRNGDLYLWDGNAWQPITITAGEIVFAGTYSASDNTIATVTTAGTAAGLTVGSALPAAANSNNRYYVIVNDSGTGTAPAPTVALQAPDMLLSDGTAWTLIDVSNTVVTQQADGIAITAISGMSATDVQEALEELYTEKADKTGGVFTGDVTLDGADLIYDTGSFNTTIAAATASAARTITYPDASGTVLLAGNASLVNADISASAAIAHSKLAPLTGGQIIVGSSGNVPTAAAITGDITLSSAGVTAIAAGAVVNADISASAAISFSKLATLTSGNIIVGNGSNVAASVPMSGDVAINSTGVTSIAAGVIIDADINASAAIAGSKIQAATTSNTGTVQLTDSTSSTSTTTAATANSVKSAYDLADAALPKSGGTMTGGIVFASSQAFPKVPQNAKTSAYTLIASDAGKHISITTGGVVIPAGVFGIGDAVSIYNNSSSDQTITQGTSVTLRQAGAATTGNRTLAQYGLVTVLCVATNTFVITGGGLS